MTRKRPAALKLSLVYDHIVAMYGPLMRLPWRRKATNAILSDRAEPPAPGMTVTTDLEGDNVVTTARYTLDGHDTGLSLTVSGLAPNASRSVAWDWLRSAPDPTGPARPSREALEVAPDLAMVLSTIPEPQLPAPRRDDWPVSASLEELRHVDPGEWCEADTALVRAVLTDDVDAYVRALIDRWQGLWWQLTWALKFQARFPAFVGALSESHRSDPRFARKRDAHRTRWIESACTIGLWDIYRELHPWPDPVAKDCVVCGRRFPPESASGAELGFGPPIACKSCNRRALSGHQLETVDVRGLLRALADRLGFPPPAAFRDARDAVASSPHRSELLALLVALPDTNTCAAAMGIPAGPGQWLSVLQQAGVVGDAWRTPRGVLTVAADGHLCRSFGELAVENYLIAKGLDHQCEPHYPTHPMLNPNGRQRADWLLGDGRWVEYAGMMDDSNYATNMTRKVELAVAAGIDLVVLTPDDLPRLGDALPASRSPRSDSQH
jgi:hypothetical protein